MSFLTSFWTIICNELCKQGFDILNTIVLVILPFKKWNYSSWILRSETNETWFLVGCWRHYFAWTEASGIAFGPISCGCWSFSVRSFFLGMISFGICSSVLRSGINDRTWRRSVHRNRATVPFTVDHRRRVQSIKNMECHNYICIVLRHLTPQRAIWCTQQNTFSNLANQHRGKGCFVVPDNLLPKTLVLKIRERTIVLYNIVLSMVLTKLIDINKNLPLRLYLL